MVKKLERLYAYRDFQLKDKDGNIIAIGTSRWIFVDTDRRRPIRLTADIAELFRYGIWNFTRGYL